MRRRKTTVRRYLMLGLAGACLLGQIGCATIASEKRYPVTVDNTHGPTFFSVQDRKNNVVHQGVTPQQVTLDAKSFPFWPAKYTVVYAGTDSMTQSRELKAGFDPWVAGNILIGGGAGAIVDGATGAMFKLPKRVEGDIPAQFAVVDPNEGSFLARAAVTGPANTTTEISLAEGTPSPTTPPVRMASAIQE